MRTGIHSDYVTDVLPAVLVFALGLSMTVAPLTTVLAGADGTDAGRLGDPTPPSPGWRALVGVSAVGAAVAAAAPDGTFGRNEHRSRRSITRS